MPESNFKELHIRIPKPLFYRLKRVMADLQVDGWPAMMDTSAYLMEQEHARNVNRRAGL